MNKRSPQSKAKATPAAPSRRQREKAMHRGEILDAAERVFSRRGFEQATMEGIAREAGFSTGALYNFFHNKDELCLQVLRKIAEDFMSVFRSTVMTIKDPMAAIDSLIELRVRHIREHGPFMRMLHENRPQLSHAAFQKELAELIAAYFGDLSGLFRKAITAGVVRKMDPVYAALAFEGVFLAFSMHWDRVDAAGPVSIEARVEIIKKNYLDHIVTGRKGK